MSGKVPIIVSCCFGIFCVILTISYLQAQTIETSSLPTDSSWPLFKQIEIFSILTVWLYISTVSTFLNIRASYYSASSGFCLLGEIPAGVIKTRKNLNNGLNLIVNMKKWARITIFAISIIHSLCLLSQYKWNTIKLLLPRLIINPPYGLNFWLFRQSLKKLAVVERSFWHLGKRCSGRCFCREVRTRVNIWTVRRDKKRWQLWRCSTVCEQKSLIVIWK